jgi:hypothetical protein
VVISELTSLALSWAVMAGGIWKLSEYIDGLLSPHGRKALASTIAKSSLREILSRSAQAFSLASDALFGKRIFSLRSLIVSVLCSFFFLVLLSLIWFAQDWQLFAIFLDEGFIGRMPYFFFFLNVVPDYLSIIETRLLLRAFRRISNAFVLFVMLAADLLAKLAIYTLGWYIWLMLIAKDSSFHKSYVKLFVEVLDQVSSFGPKYVEVDGTRGLWFPSFLAIFAFTTLLSSIWIWLYAVGIGITQFARRVDPVWNRAKIWLDLQEKPARWLGAIAVLLLSMLYLVYALFRAVHV